MNHLVYLQTLLVVAKTKNLTHAAKQLHVTTGAVSHRLKILEERIGRPLLVRGNGRMELTPTGEALRNKVDGHIEAVEAAFKHFSGCCEPFTISVMPWLASSWLMPRLHRFTNLYPETAIRIETSSAISDLNNGNIAAALRFGFGKWPHVNAEWLFDEWVAPVVQPNLVERLQLRAEHPEQWPLLRDPDNLWPLWFSCHQETSNSLNEVSLNMLPSLDLLDANTLAEAACSGLGVILGRFTQVAPLLREKKLCLLSENWVKAPRSHYLVRLEKRDPHPVFEIFRQWLHEEVRADDANVSAS